MPATTSFNDGSLEYGSAALTITPAAGGGSFTAIADSTFDYTSATKVVEQTNQYGEPLKAFGIPTTKTGSCTIQLGSTGRADRGDTFVADVTSAKVWIIESATNPYEKEGYRKQNITYREKLNA